MNFEFSNALLLVLESMLMTLKILKVCIAMALLNSFAIACTFHHGRIEIESMQQRIKTNNNVEILNEK